MSDGTGDLERIEALLGIMREYGLDALKLRVEGSSYELVRRDPSAAPAAAPPPAAPPRAAAPENQPPPNVQRLGAPLVGVFYRAAAPDAEPYASVGDRVEVGQVVCIIEAMKMMNEITSDFAGTVTRIVPENGALVATGEDLLWIEP
jgi:acetyl-CoA carboxylase biotin carboxyl carrier protein